LIEKEWQPQAKLGDGREYQRSAKHVLSTGNRIKSAFCRYRSGQCNRPAGGNYYYQGQNHVSELYFREKTLDKAKIYSENSDNECQECCYNHYRAQKAAGRLNIEGFEDSALREGKRRRSHSTARARQAGSLLEAAITEQSAHINLVMSRQCKYGEENDYPEADNRRDYPLAGRGPRDRRQMTDNREQGPVFRLPTSDF